jgi:hypothetical protein
VTYTAKWLASSSHFRAQFISLRIGCGLIAFSAIPNDEEQQTAGWEDG